MYKSSRSRFSYGKPKRSRNISPRWVLISIPVFLIVLELLARLLFGLFGISKQLADYQGEPSDVSAYRLKFETQNKETYNGLSANGSLIAQQDIFVGYRLAGKQKHQFWQINDQGFRDSEPVPLAKPSGEIRIFVIGGSSAFGYWSQSNQATISYQLQQRLQDRVTQQTKSPDKYRPDVFPFFQPSRVPLLALPPKIREGKYRVINAAVPGYTSGNELAQLALEILPYKPDLIVIMDGYHDLMLPTSDRATDIPEISHFAADAKGHFHAYLGHGLQNFIKNTYIVKSIDYYLTKPQPSIDEKSLVVGLDDGRSLVDHLPKDDKELQQRLDRYHNYHKQMVNFAAAANIPLIVATQPEITGLATSKLSKKEQKILDELGKQYQERIKQYYGQVVAKNKQLEKSFAKNVKNIDFYNFKKLPSDSFLDAVHLTEAGNSAIAQQIYYTITSLEKMQIIPQNLYL